MRLALLLSLLLTFSATIAAQQDNRNEVPQSTENQTQQKDYRNVSSKQKPVINKTPQKGYKGNVELLANMYEMRPLFLCGISTSHGYQFSPKAFLGIGLSFMPAIVDIEEYSSASVDMVTFPIFCPFVNLRLTPVAKQITPVVDLKVGYIILPLGTLKINPSVGIRLGLCKNFGINLGVGAPLYVSGYLDTFVGANLYLGVDF